MLEKYMAVRLQVAPRDPETGEPVEWNTVGQKNMAPHHATHGDDSQEGHRLDTMLGIMGVPTSTDRKKNGEGLLRA